MATAATTPSTSLATQAVQPTEQADYRATGMPAAAAISAKGGNGARDSNQPSPSLDAALARLTEALRTASVSVQFEIDTTSHRVITKVMDKASGEVIRQIPTEELVRISDAMTQLQGLFVNQTA